MLQPTAVFLCHQQEKDEATRLCSGWVGTHDIGQLLSLRLTHAMDALSDEVLEKLCYYNSPVPLFSSGREAAEHGLLDIDNPGEEAERIAQKIARNRSDIIMENS